MIWYKIFTEIVNNTNQEDMSRQALQSQETWSPNIQEWGLFEYTAWFHIYTV